MNADDNEAFEKSLIFLKSIGIQVFYKQVVADSFLPGFEIIDGNLYINKESTVFYPGDILHEAGHIAVVPAVDRQKLSNENIGKRESKDAEEMMAITWSYAACLHLKIDPRFVFHEKGYKGGSDSILTNFNQGIYFAVPMLQWIGLTAEEKNTKELNVPPFPHMIKWMRD